MDEQGGAGPLVYLAGPLFSAAERRFNAELAARLEAAGCRVFLPQRDGAEADRPPSAAMSRDERRRTMFRLDVAKVLEADAVVVVLDGRVPDEGACFELGVAYAQRMLGGGSKRLVGLKTDPRAAFLGAALNPMLAVALDAVAEDTETLLALLTAEGGL